MKKDSKYKKGKEHGEPEGCGEKESVSVKNVGRAESSHDI